MLAPLDVNHTADDIAFVKGGDEVSTPQPQRHAVDTHTADGKVKEGKQLFIKI